jgi:hypothetical protein
MKTLPTLLLCIAGAGAGTGLGWLLRGSPAKAAGAEISPSAAEQSSAPGIRRTGSIHKNPEDPAAAELSAELARRTGAMRWLYLLGAADKATPADMPRLLRAAHGVPGAMRMLAARWADMDPGHMFSTLSAEYQRKPEGGSLSEDYDLRSILFEEWAKKDPEAAIAALKDLKALPGVSSERTSMANRMMKSDPARGLQLMTEWSITNYLPSMSGIAKWAARDPRAAAEAAFAAETGHASDGLMKEIGKAWAGSDPAAALAFASEKRGLHGIQLAQAVMSDWATRDLKAALAHVNSQEESLAKAKLGVPLVQAWAKTDPQAALLWAHENLKGEGRAAAAGSIVKTMAVNDINTAAEFVAGLEPGGGKNRAVYELMETWLSREKKEDVAAALAWMGALPDAEMRRQAMESSSWRLFHSGAEETVAFLATPQGASSPQQIFDQAGRHLAKKNPESAMQWAAALPPDRRSSAQTSVLTEWIGSRPDAALTWVRNLPAGEGRRESITAVTANLAWQSVESTRDWLTSLPVADRPAALDGLKQNGSLSTENRSALEALVK